MLYRADVGFLFLELKDEFSKGKIAAELRGNRARIVRNPEAWNFEEVWSGQGDAKINFSVCVANSHSRGSWCLKQAIAMRSPSI